VNIALSKPPEKIDQKAYVVYEPQKDPLIQHIIRNTPHRSLIIFCSRKQTVKQLTAFLKRNKFNVAEIHSDLEQSEREDLLQGFKSGRIPVIVATDVLSRGIDIDTIDVVVNYDVPHDGEDYVHRIGRTARAEKEGKAFTLVSDKEIGRFARIESLIGKVVEKAPVPAELGASPEYAVHRRSGGSKGGHSPRSRPANDGAPRHSHGPARHPAHGHRNEGPRREAPPQREPAPRTGPPKKIEKRIAPERAGENPAGPVIPASGDL
jgi:superfamily II DNA/RNA helicase